MTSAPSISDDELLSDEQLVSRALGGAKDAFNQLILRHQRRLFRFLSSNAKCAADAEDALQHALLKAYLKLSSYNPKWRFTTWLFTIALRELRTLNRRATLGATSLQAHNQPAPAAKDHSPGELWSAAKRLLKSQHYTALWLRYGEDLPARDIAKILKRPRIWVSVTLHRACATLRESINSDAGWARPTIPPQHHRPTNTLHRTARGVL